MISNDNELLAAYVRDQDAEAFAAMVERHQSRVYSTCLRLLRNRADAEEISQEVFLSLAKNAHQIASENLGGWLYRCALNAANSRLRGDGARRERERSLAVPNRHADASAEWRQIEEVLDVCLAELPAESRDLLIQRFFANRSQSELAEALRVDQATISRRLKKAVDELRRGMVGRGVTLSTAALAAALMENVASASVPAGLTASLTKIGIAGIGPKRANSIAGSFPRFFWPVIGVTLAVLLLGTVPALLVAIAGQDGGPTTDVTALASPPQFTVIAEVTRLDYSRAISTSGMAVDSLGRVALFVDVPEERAGLYLIASSRLQQLHPLPAHSRRALALAPGTFAAFVWDAHVGLLDRDGMHPLSEHGKLDAAPSINRRGQVAFIETEPTSRIRLAAENGIQTLQEAGERFSQFHEVSLNDEGQVAFRAETVGGGDGLYVSARGEVTTVAEVGEEFESLYPLFDFNDRGQVVFVAELADGTQAIYVGDGERTEQIARSGAYFAGFKHVTINNRGLIAFTATTPGRSTELPLAGLYFWDGERIVDLFSAGQRLGNRVLAGVLLWRDCLNDAGQVAVLADFGENNSSAILRLETKGLDLAE